jgi:hypothetical protein
MNKHFIPFELAHEMKAIRFDETCFGFWDAYNGGRHLFLHDRYEPHWLIRTWQRIFFKKYEDTTFSSQAYVEYINGVCLAPIYSQAFDFFRENYNLLGYISQATISKGKVYMFCCNEGNNTLFEDIESDFPSYKEAQIACLTKMIQIVKDKLKLAYEN